LAAGSEGRFDRLRRCAAAVPRASRVKFGEMRIDRRGDLAAEGSSGQDGCHQDQCHGDSGEAQVARIFKGKQPLSPERVRPLSHRRLTRGDQ